MASHTRASFDVALSQAEAATFSHAVFAARGAMHGPQAPSTSAANSTAFSSAFLSSLSSAGKSVLSAAADPRRSAGVIPTPLNAQSRRQLTQLRAQQISVPADQQGQWRFLTAQATAAAAATAAATAASRGAVTVAPWALEPISLRAPLRPWYLLLSPAQARAYVQTPWRAPVLAMHLAARVIQRFLRRCRARRSIALLCTHIRQERRLGHFRTRLPFVVAAEDAKAAATAAAAASAAAAGTLASGALAVTAVYAPVRYPRLVPPPVLYSGPLPQGLHFYDHVLVSQSLNAHAPCAQSSSVQQGASICGPLPAGPGLMAFLGYTAAPSAHASSAAGPAATAPPPPLVRSCRCGSAPAPTPGCGAYSLYHSSAAAVAARTLPAGAAGHYYASAPAPTPAPGAAVSAPAVTHVSARTVPLTIVNRPRHTLPAPPHGTDTGPSAGAGLGAGSTGTDPCTCAGAERVTLAVRRPGHAGAALGAHAHMLSHGGRDGYGSAQPAPLMVSVSLLPAHCLLCASAAAAASGAAAPGGGAQLPLLQALALPAPAAAGGYSLAAAAAAQQRRAARPALAAMLHHYGVDLTETDFDYAGELGSEAAAQLQLPWPPQAYVSQRAAFRQIQQQQQQQQQQQPAGQVVVLAPRSLSLDRLELLYTHPLYTVAAVSLQRAWRLARARAAARRVRLPLLAAARAARTIQRAWRRFCDRRVYRYFRDLALGRRLADTMALLRALNPREAALADGASGVYARFRLADFPPRLYYKLYTARPVTDIGAFAPRNYAALATTGTGAGAGASAGKAGDVAAPASGAAFTAAARATPAQLAADPAREWYLRQDNNPWRPVATHHVATHLRPNFQSVLLMTASAHSAAAAQCRAAHARRAGAVTSGNEAKAGRFWSQQYSLKHPSTAQMHGRAGALASPAPVAALRPYHPDRGVRQLTAARLRKQQKLRWLQKLFAAGRRDERSTAAAAAASTGAGADSDGDDDDHEAVAGIVVGNARGGADIMLSAGAFDAHHFFSTAVGASAPGPGPDRDSGSGSGAPEARGQTAPAVAHESLSSAAEATFPTLAALLRDARGDDREVLSATFWATLDRAAQTDAAAQQRARQERQWRAAAEPAKPAASNGDGDGKAEADAEADVDPEAILSWARALDYDDYAAGWSATATARPAGGALPRR